MSGMTRSIPNISSSGNMRPQSMTTMSSPYSNTYMFLPISPTPPSGMILSGMLEVGMTVSFRSEKGGVRRDVRGRLGEEDRAGRHGADGAGGWGRWTVAACCGAPRPRLEERGRDRRDVVVARPFDVWRAERCGRVVHRKHEGIGRTRRRVDRPDRAVRLRDAAAGHEPAERMATERHDERRVEDLELALEIGGTGGNLVRFRIAILRGAALDDVGDEHLVASPAERREELDEQVAGPPDERTALAVFVLARSLADEDDLRVGVALPWHGPRPCLVEPAARAGSDVGGHLLERRQALVVGHAEPSALAPTGSRTSSPCGRS